MEGKLMGYTFICSPEPRKVLKLWLLYVIGTKNKARKMFYRIDGVYAKTQLAI